MAEQTQGSKRETAASLARRDRDNVAIKELSRLNIALNQMNGLGSNFIRGIFIGIGAVIGAAVITVALGSIAWRLVANAGIDNVLNRIGIQRAANTQTAPQQ